MILLIFFFSRNGIYYFMTNSEPPYSQGLSPYSKKSTETSSDSSQNDVSAETT